ncbi:Protein of unknown function DUF2219 [uncultured Caudovirales phage]|uniref:Lipid A deacylase LpxR family protein n=1 Tax=uncultured Caudovirales phage TaxID=2100421 RepID=A0A6J5MXC4_9CAUD|nr:Protein of unknown function DUF2219 [uncultured Caudovirales phage]
MRLYTLLLAVLLTGCAKGTYDLTENNDYLNALVNTDQQYTQGLKFRYTTEDSSESYAIGQDIYTPGHKQEVVPRPGDRPYAGWLYGEYQYRQPAGHLVEDSFGAKLGVVGPWSFAEQAQNTTHEIMGIPTAKGWDSQLDNEPGIVLTAKRSIQSLPFDFFTVPADVNTTIGVNVGNVDTSLISEAILRMKTNYGDTPLYFFFGPSGRLIARDIFLDGNTFSESRKATKVPLVADLRVGIATELFGVRVTYQYVLVTQQFEESNPVNAYGSLNFGWSF